MPAMRQKDVTGAPLMVKMVFVGRCQCAKTDCGGERHKF
jgi:hypothetical protein